MYTNLLEKKQPASTFLCGNLGELTDLCSNNYQHLLRLAPTISKMSGHYQAVVAGYPLLDLEIQNEGRYTRRICITYQFIDNNRAREPDAHLKLYLDTHQLEVITIDQQKTLPIQGLYQWPGLQQKWQANLFINKWLRYVLKLGYHFI